MCDNSIPLIDGAQPVEIRPYRHSPQVKDKIEKQVEEMLQSGVIQHSTGAFSSPAILVKKKDGTWRVCIDYRQLNSLTVKSKYPVPVIDELLDELSSAQWFSKLDLPAGYHQIRLASDEEHKTVFQTHGGHYEYKVMSFGLVGAPATFQKAMNDTLKTLLRKCTIVFFDDILVYNPTLEQHLVDLAAVLQLLQTHQWQVKLSKCSFAQHELSYLGHVISAQGVSTEDSKISIIRQWPVPQNVKELRSFLGMDGYYRKFVQHFGIIAKPLTNLLKKHQQFLWTSESATAFETLKTRLITAPVLALPNFAKTFVIEADACDHGIGAVLLQDGHPLAYLSKYLGPKNRGLSTYEKEYLAILMAVDHWRPYLLHDEFIIKTDQRSLVHLGDQRLNTPLQQKVFTKLLGLRYKICYKQGITNSVADALSRCVPASDSQTYAIIVCQPVWLEEVIIGYKSDPHAQQLVADLTVSPSTVGSFTLEQGVLKSKGRVWLGSNVSVQHKVLLALHDSSTGGHYGFPVTYRRIKQLFAWPRMKADIKAYVQSCVVCQQAKPEHVKYPGLLQPLPVPRSSWETVSMDFIEGLPKSGRYDCILVVVDKFSRYSHFIPLAHPFSAAQVAVAFVDQVYRLHGLPMSIISDRDRIFTSKFWQELFKLIGTELRMSTTYHPQTDGQTERALQHKCLVETFSLRQHTLSLYLEKILRQSFM